MKNKILLAWLLLVFAISINAQIPGYLGKRFSMQYSVLMHPSFGVKLNNFLDNQNPNESSRLNIGHVGEINYIVGKRAALCFSFQYSSLGLTYDKGNSSVFKYKGTQKYPAELQAKGLSIGLKLFPKKSIAPLGTYLKWEGILYLNRIKYDTKNVYEDVTTDTYNSWGYYTTTYTSVPLNIPSGKMNFIGGGGAFSIGKQRIFADKIMIDYGVRFAIAISGKPTAKNRYENEFKNHIYDRLYFDQFVSFKIGIGFLAF